MGTKDQREGMPREAKAWLGPALGLLGVAVFLGWSVLGVAVTFLGAFAALFAGLSFNVSVARCLRRRRAPPRRRRLRG